jgi:esterase/lipase superfamily enzyme
MAMLRKTRRLLRWAAAICVVLVAGVTAFFVFYHPPMRLMPVPLLFQDTGVELADLESTLVNGSSLNIFYATNRLPVGPQSNRLYSVVPDRRLHVGEATVRIGDESSTLDQIYEWSTRAGVDDRPFVNLERMNEVATLDRSSLTRATKDAGVEQWLSDINALLAQSRVKDILVYVHGANTTVERAVGQASQLRHFSGRNAVVVVFVWPTAENFLRYSQDIQNALGSAPHLAALIRLLAQQTDAKSINVFTYSAGATVGSEALALLSELDTGSAAKLGEVFHAAPDADFRQFVDDMKVYAKKARRVTTALNLGDSALRLASVISGNSRAGRPDLLELGPEAARWVLNTGPDFGAEVVQVSPETMPDLPASSHTFWYDDPWVSSDVLLTMLFHLTPEQRGLAAGEAEGGGTYWTFPADYVDIVPNIRSAVADELRRRAIATPQP